MRNHPVDVSDTRWATKFRTNRVLVPETFAEKARTEKPVSTATGLFGDRTNTCCKLSAGMETVADMGCCDRKLPCVERYSTDLLTELSIASRTCCSADTAKLYPEAGAIFTLKGKDTCTLLKDGNETVLVVAADRLRLSKQVKTKSIGDNPIDSTRTSRTCNNSDCNAT